MLLKVFRANYFPFRVQHAMLLDSEPPLSRTEPHQRSQRTFPFLPPFSRSVSLETYTPRKAAAPPMPIKSVTLIQGENAPPLPRLLPSERQPGDPCSPGTTRGVPLKVSQLLLVRLSASIFS